jgi:hypothetical protein
VERYGLRRSDGSECVGGWCGDAITYGGSGGGGCGDARERGRGRVMLDLVVVRCRYFCGFRYGRRLGDGLRRLERGEIRGRARGGGVTFSWVVQGRLGDWQMMEGLQLLQYTQSLLYHLSPHLSALYESSDS